MNRREFLPAVGLGAAAASTALSQQAAKSKGRLNQSLCRWCYRDVPIDELAAEAARLGLKSIDLIDRKEWAAIKKYGLIPTMVNGGSTIPDGYNRKENHETLLQKLRESIEVAAAEGVPSVIVFSGNRRGMSDEEGLDNCVAGLSKIKSFAEDKGVLVCMELLNSKVNHADYMCDKTAWGVEMVKRINSPNIKLLYDIYHMQIMEGDVIRTIRENHQYIGHYHTGGNPGRNEIDGTQELNYTAISRAIADLNFNGYFAHEFIPKRDWRQSLAQAAEICTV
ncbi:MAG: hydroxypyruvate isomerase family protein [Bryobacteraceae bacterium]